MEHKHRIKEENGVIYCTACGHKNPSSWETCYGYGHKHSYKLQEDGSIMCTKCADEGWGYSSDCYGDGHNHQFKKIGGKTFCTKCGRDYSDRSWDCRGKDHGHNYTLNKDGNIVCKKCGQDYSEASWDCDPSKKPKRETKPASYEKTIAKAINLAAPHRVVFLAAIVYIKGGWSRTCLRGRAGVEKKIIQNLRDNVKEKYEEFELHSKDYVLSEMYEAFQKESDTGKAIVLTMAADIVSDREQRLTISKALHYKDSVWETLDEHVDYYARNNK